ncbi:MAG: extracellular solute-binding protein [Ruminococcaceae bacterium]|nr:extracellular solute-binding protein [Oscillospiraceae bacterium]
MKKLLAMLMALVMVLSFAACGETPEEPSDPEAPAEPGETEATGSVYWLNFKPESDEVLKELAAKYTAETGVEVKIETAASGTYNETLTAEMDKSEAPTIFVVGNQAAVDTWGDYCLDLTGTAIADELNTDAYMLYDADGKLCSIGYCYECYGIIVNNALLNEAGHDVSEITNFETLKAVVEDITARSEELGFGAFTSNAMDGSSSWRYTGHMINLEYYYEYVDDNAAWANGTAAAPTLTGAYMNNFRNLYDLAVANSIVDRKELANGGFDAQAEFAEGKAVFYVQGSWEASGLEGKGMDLSTLSMIPYYCGVEGEEKAGLNCGTENYWAINGDASEEDIQATIDFMVWLVTDPEASEAAVGTFGVMPYKSAAVSTNPFLAQANAYLADGCYNMAWITNFQPNVDAYRATAVNALNAYNADPTDANWATVVTAFIDGWAVQYQAVNG